MIWLPNISTLPTTGISWDALVKSANGSWGTANLSDLDAKHDVYTLSGALYSVRVNNSTIKAKTIDALKSVVGTEKSSRGLEVSRNITCYAIAADLVGFRDPAWVSWISALRTKPMTDGKTIVSTQETRPNNWGTHASAARIAIDLYLNSQLDLNRATNVFKGWLGDVTLYSGFKYGDLSWQSGSPPRAINPVGGTKAGHNIDGVLPDDQRRGGSFTWPPPCEGYVHEALQGALVAAQLLAFNGQPAFDWSNKALLRAYTWLYGHSCPATGDDGGYPFIVNKAYGTAFKGTRPAPMGKNMGFLDWQLG